MKLFDSEYKVMDILWQNGDIPAKKVSDILHDTIHWNKNTTYTIIQKLVKKGIVERREPNFVCHPLLSKEQAQQTELDSLIDRIFDGSVDLLFASLLTRKKLPMSVIEELKQKIDQEEKQ